MSEPTKTSPGTFFSVAGYSAFVFAGWFALMGLFLRVGASMGPEDDVDKANELASGYWMLALTAVLVAVGIVLCRAGARRRRAGCQDA